MSATKTLIDSINNTFLLFYPSILLTLVYDTLNHSINSCFTPKSVIIVVITVPIGFVLASVAPFGRHLNVQGTRCIIKDHGHWFRSDMTLDSALLDPTCPEEHLLPIRSCMESIALDT
jgi:hypothetical protein